VLFVFSYVGRSLAIAHHSVQGRGSRSLVKDGAKISHRLVNKANVVHNFSQYVYFFSLNVSGDYVPVIRRNNCVYTTLGMQGVIYSTQHTRQSYIQNNKYQVSHKYSFSPDDGYIVARNM
jgi:hypothetical protein